MKISDLTVDDNNVVSWKELEDKFGNFYPSFRHWLRGQTTTPDGVYIEDIEKFVMNRSVVD